MTKVPKSLLRAWAEQVRSRAAAEPDPFPVS
jgi:hypothetical protein